MLLNQIAGPSPALFLHITFGTEEKLLVQKKETYTPNSNPTEVSVVTDQQLWLPALQGQMPD